MNILSSFTSLKNYLSKLTLDIFEMIYVVHVATVVAIALLSPIFLIIYLVILIFKKLL